MPKTSAYVPPDFVPTAARRHAIDMGWDQDTDLIKAVFESLGAASMCWTETPTGIFDSEQALGVGAALIDFVQTRYAPIPRQ